MVEDGLNDLDEALKDGLAAIELDRDRTKSALDPVKAQFVLRVEIDPSGRRVRRTSDAGERNLG